MWLPQKLIYNKSTLDIGFINFSSDTQNLTASSDGEELPRTSSISNLKFTSFHFHENVKNKLFDRATLNFYANLTKDSIYN